MQVALPAQTRVDLLGCEALRFFLNEAGDGLGLRDVDSVAALHLHDVGTERIAQIRYSSPCEAAAEWSACAATPIAPRDGNQRALNLGRQPRPTGLQLTTPLLPDALSGIPGGGQFGRSAHCQSVDQHLRLPSKRLRRQFGAATRLHWPMD